MLAFDCSYTVKPARSDALRDKVHRLRYQVYCIENAFENPAHYPDKRERDGHDDHAAHSLLIHEPTKIAVGGVRLIPCEGRAGSGRLPIQDACRSLPSLEALFASTHRVGEVSRFCVSKEELKRVRSVPSDLAGPAQPSPNSVGITMGHACLALLSAVVEMAAASQVTHICALMAPSLLRYFAGFGLNFTPLGSPVDHHGLRQPVYSHLGDLLAGAHRLRPDAWEMITRNGDLWPFTPDTSALPLKAAA
jgi:N-acyl amino acid synthase of PEP-CTERM/exosortase system